MATFTGTTFLKLTIGTPIHDGPDYIDLFDADGITADAQAMLHEEDTNGDFV